jgi:serine protease Do
LSKPVELNVVRDGKPVALKVTVEEQPQEFGSAQAPARVPRRTAEGVALEKLGLNVSDLTRQQAEKLGLKDASGALVVKVQPGSVADEAGLERGVVVTRVDKQPVRSAVEFRELTEKGSLEKGLLLQVHSADGGTSYVLLKTGSDK